MCIYTECIFLLAYSVLVIREPSLKRKCLHFDEIFITGCTGSCQNDNFQCSQWLKFRQNDDIFVSVVGLGYTPFDQRERHPGPLLEPGHLQDLGLFHQQPMGRSGGQPDRVSTWVEHEPVGSRRQRLRRHKQICDVTRTWTCALHPDRHVEWHQ